MGVSLENLSVSLVPAACCPSAGNCKATETTDGDLEACTRLSLAAFGRFESRIERERSTFLLLCLVAAVSPVQQELNLMTSGKGRHTYLSVYCSGL